MLTDADRTRYIALLEAAEAAYHSLMIGGQPVDFQDQNGERIRYSAANPGRLLTYINWLRSVLGMCPFVMPSVARPAGVFF